MNKYAQLTKGDAITVAWIEKGERTLVTAGDLVEHFHQMVRERDPFGLPILITDAANRVLASFGKGIGTLTSAMTQRWSKESQSPYSMAIHMLMESRCPMSFPNSSEIGPAPRSVAGLSRQSGELFPLLSCTTREIPMWAA